MTYGRTVTSHTFMARAANHSTKGSRRGFVDVNTGVDPSSLLTPAQRRDSLKRQHEALGRLRTDMKAGKVRGSKEEWERLGVEMHEIQNELSALNASMPRTYATFEGWFNACAKSMLPGSEYARIAEEARRRMTEGDAQ